MPAHMLAATLGKRCPELRVSPGTSSKGLAMLRGALFEAQAYNERMRGGAGADGAGGEPLPARDLTNDVLGRVLGGALSLLVTANRVTEAAAALRLQREFGFDLVLDGRRGVPAAGGDPAPPACPSSFTPR